MPIVPFGAANFLMAYGCEPLHASRKPLLRFEGYDPGMKKMPRYLPLAVFLIFAFAFDSLSVAAIFEVGFEGVQRVLLATLCVIVGTISAYILTSTLMRVCVRR